MSVYSYIYEEEDLIQINDLKQKLVHDEHEFVYNERDLMHNEHELVLDEHELIHNEHKHEHGQKHRLNTNMNMDIKMNTNINMNRNLSIVNGYDIHKADEANCWGILRILSQCSDYLLLRQYI
jgi:ABC-type Zn2+ transport system substrate-binding protein/surface adhesin